MVHTVYQFDDLGSIQAPLHLALGVFDGVHIGHQAVIQSAVDAASLDAGVAGVLTFDPHPIQLLAPSVAPQRILASLDHKRDLLAEFGVELLVVIPFTREFAERDAHDFLASIVSNTTQLSSLSIGEDWRFGKDRRGDTQLLQEFGEKHEVKISSLPPVMLEGERVSSTRIRQAIRDGNLEAASSMLGRPYTVLGTVIEGEKTGRTLGHPTANLKVYNEQLPCNGVWAVNCVIGDGETHLGAANLGVRPSIDGSDKKRLLEVHLIDFEGDIYGQDMEVTFLQLIRNEQKFESLDALKDQITKDVSFCKKLRNS
ncbi:MAG TPA: bifunctional riboflavin kinase/FAD synthetase [Verrucomicrobiales bacterium]|jgi:riboflavin kinase/FMN adenylyltransferase|nr:bifunctional riboflavin kinase/FAD synthetase [Verrucomicrobiales bacterium]